MKNTWTSMILFPVNDEVIYAHMERWITEAGGWLPMTEALGLIEQHLADRVQPPPPADELQSGMLIKNSFPVDEHGRVTLTRLWLEELRREEEEDGSR